MVWWLVYVGLVLALVVRVSTVEAEVRDVPAPSPTEPLRLVAIHHAIFFVLLVIAVPVEAMLRGPTPAWRWVGALAFGAGVGLYRAAGSTLGDALSPFVEPAPGAQLVTSGVYGRIRHPMYLGQALIAIGAPLTVGVRWALGLSALAVGVLGVRVWVEERALRRTYPEYGHYATRAKRILPFVF